VKQYLVKAKPQSTWTHARTRPMAAALSGEARPASGEETSWPSASACAARDSSLVEGSARAPVAMAKKWEA